MWLQGRGCWWVVLVYDEATLDDYRDQSGKQA